MRSWLWVGLIAGLLVLGGIASGVFESDAEATAAEFEAPATPTTDVSAELGIDCEVGADQEAAGYECPSGVPYCFRRPNAACQAYCGGSGGVCQNGCCACAF